MIFRSIVGKLWVTIVGFTLVAFIFLGFFLSQVMEDYYLDLRANELVYTSNQLATAIGEVENPQVVLSSINLLGDVVNANLLVLDRRGLVQANSGPLHLRPGSPLDHPDLERVIRGDTIVRKGTHPTFKISMMSVAVPIYHNSQVVGGLFIDAPLAQMNQAVADIRQIIFSVAAGTTLLAAMLAYFLTRSITRPLLEMNKAAQSMARGDFAVNVRVWSGDEVGTLGSTLNQLGAELEQNMQALQNEKTQLANILASMTDAVISFDNLGRIITLNPLAEKILTPSGQLSPGELLPKSRETDKIKLLLEQAITGETRVVDEVKIGENIYTIKLAPIRWEDEVTGVVAVLNDITKERKLDQLRRDFIANVSHELRTPLSFLQGYVEAILDGLAQTEAEREEYLGIILEETLRLRRLVNELLDLTQMESGQLSLNMEPVDLAILLQMVKRKLTPAARELKIDFQLIIPRKALVVTIDQDRIEQALINLLDNGFRYSQGGKVIVRVIERNSLVEVEVSDDGEGIPDHQLPYLFDRFYKVDKARTRKGGDTGGTGLGLAIVRNIINAHGQQINVTSQIGKGTKFTFTLPLLTEGEYS